VKRIVIATALVVSIAVAAVSTAAPGTEATKNASVACTALKAKIGATAFTQAYPTFGACVSSLARVEQQNVDSAQAACTAEQNDPTFALSHNGRTFDQYYGVGRNGKNAFGNCVSTKAKASSQAEQHARPNPARTCRTLRAQMGTSTFSLTYGKNANDRNAFGKCVSKAAKAETQNEVNASAACRDEQSDVTFAVNHSGKTFAQYYGTNADLSNAFGKCVSGKASETGQAQQQATVSAAKTCATERNTDPAAFRTKYGTFGRCVSQHASSK
jgi:hypothetical protein